MREICLKCFRSTKHCLCSFIRPFDPGIKFIILIHPMELKKEKVGTGRLAKLCLQDSEMIDGVDFSNHPRVNELLLDPKYFPAVLYPGENAINVSTKNFQVDLQGKKLLLFLIDGTWPCAKKMMKLSTNLHGLPRLTFSSDKRSNFLIKQQPHELCLSTIESIHFFLSEWERAGRVSLEKKSDTLLEVFGEMVKFQLKCASDPYMPSYRKKKFRPPSERKPAKKWTYRKLFYK